MPDPVPVRPTGATLCLAATCSGHIDPSVERYRDNRTGVFKLTAIQMRFLAMSEIARIKLIWQTVGRYSGAVTYSGLTVLSHELPVGK